MASPGGDKGMVQKVKQEVLSPLENPLRRLKNNGPSQATPSRGNFGGSGEAAVSPPIFSMDALTDVLGDR